MSIEIRKIEAGDCKSISEAFYAQGWYKTEKQFISYLSEQSASERIVLLAFFDNQFAGYLTIKWVSFYPPFKENNIPEIMDLNVLKKFRNKGVATKLMDTAEQIVSKCSASVGIGVGLTKDYGNAQALYVKRGYIPDRNGISYNETFLKNGDNVKVDDDLVLCFIKDLE